MRQRRTPGHEAPTEEFQRVGLATEEGPVAECAESVVRYDDDW